MNSRPGSTSPSIASSKPALWCRCNVYRLADEERIGIANHPLEQLLANPNPLTSRFELFEQTLGSLELHGNAYWFLAGDGQRTGQTKSGCCVPTA